MFTVRGRPNFAKASLLCKTVLPHQRLALRPQHFSMAHMTWPHDLAHQDGGPAGLASTLIQADFCE
ncbi:hypothetical protein BG74_02645 [Sodalis-like endosymbiont of Proechinophthirus fluctus]|nr:hypothetical protein BG74_02645 [Sodalis-like endosymbiont of Proechinophthirus fluctus]